MLLNIIVAISRNNGIGKCGGLPWKLKKDMEFFKKITTKAQPGLQNVVIMGRLTWDSIPNSFKPLKGRINIVVSNTLSCPSSDYYVVPSLDAALELLGTESLRSIIDNVFVIGGARLYKETLEQNKHPVRIYCTHVLMDIDCDVFFPKIEWEKLTEVDLPDVSKESFTENGLVYKFKVYDLPLLNCQ